MGAERWARAVCYPGPRRAPASAGRARPQRSRARLQATERGAAATYTAAADGGARALSSQVMANDVRPWALPRLRMAPQESPEDRLAAPSGPRSAGFALLSGETLPLPAASKNGSRSPAPQPQTPPPGLFVSTAPQTHTGFHSFFFNSFSTRRGFCLNLKPANCLA